MVVFIVFETPIGGEEKIIKIELLEELNFTNMTPGKKFRDAIKNNSPLIIPGAINAYSAKLAERANHKAIYLSGSGVAAASYGLPDLGVTSLDDVVIDAKRITDATDLPLLVDIDTGWGGSEEISNTIVEMENAGVAAVHIEDQVYDKRCGHRPNKQIVSVAEMQDRIKAAVDAKKMNLFLLWQEQPHLHLRELKKLLKDVMNT